MTSKPLYALLLDVDGPVASPVTRTLAIDSIAADLVAMARAGVPLVFNTGRSDVFVARTVMPSLVAAGLPDDAVVLAVCEKGSTWFVPKPEHLDGAGDDLEVDEAADLGLDLARRAVGEAGAQRVRIGLPPLGEEAQHLAVERVHLEERGGGDVEQQVPGVDPDPMGVLRLEDVAHACVLSGSGCR